MNLAAIPPHAPFLDTVAERWLAAGDDPEAGLVLLPSRRAARGLADAFLRVSQGRPLLLPRILGIGALDEAGLALHGALDLPPAVSAEERAAVLTRLILALDGQFGAPRSADAAWPLAGELAALMDEAELAGIELATALPNAAEEQFAAHWQQTLKFLGIVTALWPDWLQERGLAAPARRLVALLDAQAEAWALRPPAHRVWAVGFSGGIPALFRLLRVVAGLPRGLVLVPGLLDIADRHAWEALPADHAQDGLRRLLNGMGARQDEATPWPAPHAAHAGRAAMLLRALLPASGLDAWRAKATLPLGGLSRLAAADEQEEAVAIALSLRAALAEPGTRAALVTPDRALAQRVAAELGRFGIVADDSAGRPVSRTPPAVFLRLLARAAAENFAPVALLSLLKHPLAAAGLAPVACRELARALENPTLRGPRPAGGLDGLRRALGPDVTAPLADFLDRLAAALAPLAALPRRDKPEALLAALVTAGEKLAASDTETGPDRLWRGEAGEALSAHLAALFTALATVPEQEADTLPGLFDALLEGAVVRPGPRRDGMEEHPRLHIWGLLEARLQSVDVVVLGGLVEAVWPPIAESGPWMSRPMRLRAGLPSPEERVGAAALDFVLAACCAPVAILSAPRRRDGAPSVPARWLARLDAMLAGAGMALPEHPAALWARALDQPETTTRLAPPRPCPDVALRPRRLSVTEIETLIRDPYAIYARHVLRLRRLPPIEEEAEPADYGSVVHDGLQRFYRDVREAWPADAPARLRDAMDRALAEAGLRPVLAAWWRPRLRRIADWVVAEETRRRARAAPTELGAECTGAWQFAAPAGPFELRGRADRIERRADETLAILDYKTGEPPTKAELRDGHAPQLPLEAVMCALGAFPGLQGETGEITYWHLTGGYTPGEARTLDDPALLGEIVASWTDRVRDLVAAYDEPGRAYLSQPNPGRVPRFSDYTQLARVAEWMALEGEE